MQVGQSQSYLSAVYFRSYKIVERDIPKRLKNEYVAVLLPNSILFLITYFAVLVSGNKPALLNFLLPESALGKLLDDLQPSLVLSNKKLSKYEHLMLEIQDYLDIEQLDIKEINHSCIGDDVGAVLFSGGTTGIPKQINHSHKSISLMVDRMEWGWPTRPNENWLVVAPFTHIYGFLTGVTCPLLKSGTVFIPEAFDPNLVVEKLSSEKITIFGGGPLLYIKLYSLLRSLKKVKYRT